MGRKKTETTENIEEVKKDVVEAVETLKEEAVEEKKVEESLDGEEHKKKKEKRKLSENELKRVMTDTKETLVPLTDYIRCGVHLGTKVITPHMRKYVYKRRADGLAVMNTAIIDDKLREAAKFLSQFAPEDVFIACKREAGWKPTEKFSETTGIRAFTKKYPAGIITNLKLDTFFEARAIIVCDPWVDKNALQDGVRLKVPVMSICDTNNYTHGVSQIIASNNKSTKSIGLVLFILAREYLKLIGKSDEAKELKLEDFTGKLEEPMMEKAGYGV
jgi:small subunit ribosomal protein S2